MTDLERCDAEIAALRDAQEDGTWGIVMAEADWTAEKHMILREAAQRERDPEYRSKWLDWVAAGEKVTEAVSA